MKKLLLTLLCAVQCVLCSAGIPPSIHVEGRDLVDTHGNKVVMHGVMDTPSQWFNSGRWGKGGYDASDAPSKCIKYFDEIFTAITDTTRGTYCTVFRLHLDPCWTNNGSITAKGFTQKDGKWYDPDGVEVGGEADIKNFDKARLRKFFTSVYWPIIGKALNHGLHVVVRPPGVCPGRIRVGGYYQQYLKEVWGLVSSNANMKKYAGQVSIELANEPVAMVNADGSESANTMHDFFQPIADTIRANGFTGIIWVPGKTWQQDYRGYATYPITGYNIGYAAHAYVGWYGGGDNNTGENLLRCFLDGVPVVKDYPVIVTEIDWSPENMAKEGHYNESGAWVQPNYGTWATGTTSGWGGAFKYAKDVLGNVSMTLTSTDDYIDMGAYHDSNGKILRAAFSEEMKANGLDPYEGCGQACMDWYKEYYKENQPKADYTNLSTNMNAGQTQFLNPVVAADFPDPDIAKLGDTYYMLSSTFHLVPGATLLKSKDLVNWEYCNNPLEKLSDKDKYNLIGGQYAYAGGMWAGAIEEHDGKLYILINANDAGAYVLSTSDPDGKWDVKKLSRGYYDPGMIFEGDKIYIVCGIDHINICELDKDWNFIKETNVIQKSGTGLEGSHLYHIGDYYYIYSTYGGWPTAQTIFRSTSITGPYEEHEGMLFDKTINNVPNTVHQGALVMTDTGEWWTMLMEDKGAIGRLPSLHPVTWKDGWPTLGTNAVPLLTYKRPKFKSYPAVTVPATNDNFRNYRLGNQWQWNHTAAAGKWSLIERPGYLRLRTATVTDEMMLAQGTLTQRIFAFRNTAGGLNTSKASTGTIALDVRNMEAGDMAGIAVQQDPYAMIAVTVDDNGQYSLVWKSGTHDNVDNFVPDSKTIALEGFDTEAGIIYLRAKFNCGNSEATFFYSLDNKKWTQLGGATSIRFNLSLFTGARWAIFNYATQDLGGYVDVDWFSTEDNFDEINYFPAEFAGYNADMLTATSVSMEKDEFEVMIGSQKEIEIMATFADGHTENVAAQARYTSNWPEMVSVSGGRIIGRGEGQATITAVYTDPMGTEHKLRFKVSSTYFPFGAEFIKFVWDTGTYNESKRQFIPKAYGQMGWEYSSPVDMSGYKYLVLLLDKTQNCDGDIRLYAQPSIWGGSCFIKKINSSKKVILNLHDIKYTDGDKKGAAVEIDKIYKVVFWTNGGSTGIDVKDMYLTNNSDYSREIPTGIDDVDVEVEAPAATVEGIYNLAGQRIARPTRPGIYIVNGHKVVIK